MNKITLNKSLRKLYSKGVILRAEHGEHFYYIDVFFRVDFLTELNDSFDTDLYNVGNYFRTKEVAETVLNQIREILNEYSSPERMWNKPYYIINGVINAVILYDDVTIVDDNLYNAGNYFRTEEDANIVCERIREILNNH